MHIIFLSNVSIQRQKYLIFSNTHFYSLRQAVLYKIYNNYSILIWWYKCKYLGSYKYLYYEALKHYSIFKRQNRDHEKLCSSNT